MIMISTLLSIIIYGSEILAHTTTVERKIFALGHTRGMVVMGLARLLGISGVYARGSKRSHPGGKCVTCRGLHILA